MSIPNSQRIVVTGMGTITPIGNNMEEFLEGLKLAKRAFGPVRRFNGEGYAVNCASEIQDPEEIETLTGSRSSRLIQLAAREAIENSKLPHESLLERTALVLGTCLGSDEIDRAMWQESVGREPDLAGVVTGRSDSGGRAIIDTYKLTGPSLTVVTACAAGTNAVGLGMDLIRNARADRALVGGLDTLTQLTYGGFSSIGALATECLPFSEERNGTILGETASILVLERLDLALERGATIYAEILGYGLSNDAFHMTAPHTDGLGAILAMKRCLEDAHLNIENIDYVNAHGTGTPRNDEMELLALQSVFGDHLDQLMVSSTKSQIGHGLSSAGATELIATILGIYHNFVPSTAHERRPIQEGVQFVQGKPINKRIDIAISNSFAFGGHCATIAIKRWGDSIE